MIPTKGVRVAKGRSETVKILLHLNYFFLTHDKTKGKSSDAKLLFKENHCSRTWKSVSVVF